MDNLTLVVAGITLGFIGTKFVEESVYENRHKINDPWNRFDTGAFICLLLGLGLFLTGVLRAIIG